MLNAPGFNELLEAVPDAVVIVDHEGVIRTVNRQAEDMFGHSRADLLGRPVESLLPERYRESHVDHREAYAAHPRTRAMGAGMELFGRRGDGSDFPVEVSLSPMTLDGTPLVISTIRDVTERKQAEKQLRSTAADLTRSNAELEQFAYVASHDLQEPLRMVASYTQLLARRYRGKLDSDADEFIGFAVDGALRMQALINDLLDYSRAGTRPLRLEVVDTNAMVDQVTHDLSSASSLAGATITHDELPQVVADPTQLHQVFQNLMANGVKFHKPNQAPVVHVSGAGQDAMFSFTVEDNGIGIEAQYLERIFTLFQRLHTREEYPGTGIGLAICKRIVERHGGQISVESAPDVGAKFSFTLPVTRL